MSRVRNILHGSSAGSEATQPAVSLPMLTSSEGPDRPLLPHDSSDVSLQNGNSVVLNTSAVGAEQASKPPAAEKPVLTAEETPATIEEDSKLELRAAWSIPITTPPVTFTSVAVRAVGDSDWQLVDRSDRTGENVLVSTGGHAISADTSSVLISGLEAGKSYQCIVAMKNAEGEGGWSSKSDEVVLQAPEVMASQMSESAFISGASERMPRATMHTGSERQAVQESAPPTGGVTFASSVTSKESEPAPARIPWRKRQLFKDNRYESADLCGLHSKEFEVDLLMGERIHGAPIRVRLKRTVSFWRQLACAIFTFGLYVIWIKCCAGVKVFDVDARLALTTHGRLLLWTHQAGGGGLPFFAHMCRAVQHPQGFGTIVFLILFFAIGPFLLGFEFWEVTAVVLGLCVILFITHLLSWLFETASLSAVTTVRQFDACDLSCVRLLCYTFRSWWWQGEVTSCHVHMFFGPYPKPVDINRVMPWSSWDSNSVMPSPIIGAQTTLGKKLADAAGQGFMSAENQFTSIAAAILILLAFSAFLNEMTDFLSGLYGCTKTHKGDSITAVLQCANISFDQWWTGVESTGLQTVISHWIDLFDWSLQLLLFFYVVGPAMGTLWKTVSDQSGAGLGFIVDRRSGTATEDEHFEEHWQEITDFVGELFERGSSRTPEAVGRLPEGESVDGNPILVEEIDGDVNNDFPEVNMAPPGTFHTPLVTAAAAAAASDAPSQEAMAGRARLAGGIARPSVSRGVRFSDKRRATWAQVEEMTSSLVDPYTSKVRVYKGVLSWLKGERVLAAYPERPRMTWVVIIKAIITCGIDYFLYYRRERRESAIILTDRRLMQVSCHTSRTRRSLKVDMYGIGGAVKYLSFNPPRRQCCRVPPGRIALASKCGTLELTLHRMRSRHVCAQQLWQGLTLMQDAPPLTSQEFDSFASVDEAEEEDFAADPRVQNNEGLQEATAMWGRAARLSTRPSMAGRLSSASGRPSMAPGRLSNARPSLFCARESLGIMNNAELGSVDGPQVDLSTRENPDALGVLPLITQVAIRNEPWSLVLDKDEICLWGPTLFEDDIWVPACCPNKRAGFKAPTTLVTITNRRLAVVQFGYSGSISCGAICFRSFIESVTVVPLRWVLGFCIEETFALQRAMFTRLLGQCCCWPSNESRLVIKILTNAGLGKVFLNSLDVRQKLLPFGLRPRSAFEDDSVLELRRWLGNVALFFVELDDPNRKKIHIELWRCAHGLAPS